MKKLLCLILAVFFVSSAIAEVDLSTMTTAELRVLQREITNEIIARSVEPEHNFTLTDRETVNLINDNEVALFFTGRTKDQPLTYCIFEMAFYNYSSLPQGIRMENVYLNGWKLDSSSICSTIKTGERKRCEVAIKYLDAFLSAPNGMNELVFTITTSGEDYSKIKDYGTFRIKFEPSFWGK